MLKARGAFAEMEIILSSLIDWLHEVLKNRPALMWLLTGILLTFGCWLTYMEWMLYF